VLLALEGAFLFSGRSSFPSRTDKVCHQERVLLSVPMSEWEVHPALIHVFVEITPCHLATCHDAYAQALWWKRQVDGWTSKDKQILLLFKQNQSCVMISQVVVAVVRIGLLMRFCLQLWLSPSGIQILFWLRYQERLNVLSLKLRSEHWFAQWTSARKRPDSPNRLALTDSNRFIQ